MHSTQETHSLRPRTLLPLLQLTMTALLVIVLIEILATPAPVHADEPVTEQTIVSRNGAHWNAPLSSASSFASFAPNTKPKHKLVGVAPSDGVQTEFSTQSIIGKDGRVRVKKTEAFPYRAIVYLRIEFEKGITAECTGGLIGPRTIATAAHCIYDPAWGWAQSARVYPALNAKIAPFGFANAIEFYSVQGWITSALPDFDYGAIQLDSAIGKQTGWLGMSLLKNTDLLKTEVRVTGYPGDKPRQTMWTDADRVYRTSPSRLFYSNDTFAGESGSPVYAGKVGGCANCVVAIHGYGMTEDPKGRFNSGVRVTPQVLSNYLAWRSLP